MNRRDLFRLLPLSALGIPAMLKGETHTSPSIDWKAFDEASRKINALNASIMDSVNRAIEPTSMEPSLWRVYVCDKKRPLPSGKIPEYPMSGGMYGPKDEGKVAAYAALPVCGARFKYILGTAVKCPSCGQWSAPCGRNADVGILC